MSNYIAILLSASMFLAASVRAAQTARVRLYSISIPVTQSYDEYGDFINFNSTGTPAGQDELYTWLTPGEEFTLPGPTGYAPAS